MKVAVDTSVVVRLLVGEPQGQFAKAKKLLENLFARGERACVSDLVCAEAYFALRHHYGLPEIEAGRLLHSLLRAAVIAAEPPGLDEIFTGSSSAGVVDRMIVLRHNALGLQTLTCDRGQAKLDNASLI